jgi:hypothetical protein
VDSDNRTAAAHEPGFTVSHDRLHLENPADATPDARSYMGYQWQASECVVFFLGAGGWCFGISPLGNRKATIVNKPQFSEEYRTLLRRWTQLGNQETRTWREQMEYEAADRALTAVEVGTVRALVDDYDEAMQLYQAGNLGAVEL